MVLCMTMISVSTGEYIFANGTDFGAIIGPINWCSAHRTHYAIYISLEDKYDGTMISDTRKGNVEQVLVTPHFPKHFSNSFDIYMCVNELSVVETYYSFFGGKSVNGRWVINNPMSAIECRNYLDKIKRSINTLLRLRLNVWSDKTNQITAQFTWCCKSVNSTQNRIIIKQFNAVLNFVANVT